MMKEIKGNLVKIKKSWFVEYYETKLEQDKHRSNGIFGVTRKKSTKKQIPLLYPAKYYFLEDTDNGAEVKFNIHRDEEGKLSAKLIREDEFPRALNQIEQSALNETLKGFIKNKRSIDKPLISDNFQIGPEGAFEYGEESWEDVIKKYPLELSSSDIESLAKWLDKNYYEPIKK